MLNFLNDQYNIGLGLENIICKIEWHKIEKAHMYVSLSGEYRGRTDDLLHAMQAL